MRAIEAVTTPGETAALGHSVGVSRAALFRRRRPAPRATPPRPRAPSPRALGATERQAVLNVLHSERFIDQSPAEVHATLLEEQRYLCAPRTMYRVLAAATEVRERRAQARHPAYTAPELVASDVYKTLENHRAHRSPKVLIPPRKGAQLALDSAGTRQRNRNIRARSRVGKRKWYVASGYSRRSKVETTFHRYKAILGSAMRARGLASQRVEVRLGCKILNTMTALGIPDGEMIG